MIDINSYNEFISFSNNGLKQNAEFALKNFIRSFNDIKEKVDWTKSNLAAIELNNSSRIRYELFNNIILPALLDGFKKNDVFSYYWLAKLVNNYSDDKKTNLEINNMSPTELLETAYAMDKSNVKIREELINSWIKFVSFSEHECPDVILDGMNAATKKACIQIKKRNQEIIALDIEKKHVEYLLNYEKKVDEYFKSIDSLSEC